MNDPGDQFDQHAFARDLRALYDSPIAVPPQVNQHILNRARAHFARPRASRRLLRWTAAAVAAAAVVAVGVRLGLRGDYSAPHAVLLGGDLDGNGRVDIRDALLLARRIDAQDSLDVAASDLNHDGRVDRHDVDAIAMLAVRLDRGGVR